MGRRKSIGCGYFFWGCDILFVLLPFSFAEGGDHLSFSSSDFLQPTFQNVEIDFSNQLTLVNRWNIITTGIGPRYNLGFAFDQTRGRALVFGGVNENGQEFSDTWEWNSASSEWTQVNPSIAPSARSSHALVWAGDEFLLYGGIGSETWSYSLAGSSWTLVATSSSPSADLTLPAMAYDVDRRKVVLFGGGASNTTWIYNVSAASWSAHNLNSAPGARVAAQMAYDRASQRVILFGGRSPSGSQYLGDTWSFNVANLSWTELNPSSAPGSRAEMGMAYDSIYGQIFIYGGRQQAVGSAMGDMYYYHFAKNRWISVLSTNNDSPSGRFGHGMIFDSFNNQVLVLGGRLPDGSTVSSLWSRALRSTGTATSNVKSVAGSTAITWNDLSVVFQERPQNTDALLQVAFSSDGTTFDSFRGPDGQTTSFYSSSSTPIPLWSGHNGRRYLKIKADFLSQDPPYRPRLTSIDIAYNQAPFSPVPETPANTSRANTLTPAFGWQASSDPDGSGDLPLLYQLQVASDTTFISPRVSQESISASSFTIPVDLSEGTWYWRVRAKDNQGFYGNWSSAFSVILDTTTPPGPVNEMVAAIGPGNGQIVLRWTFPGDDKGSVAAGRYRIRFSTDGAIASEAAWTALSQQEVGSLFSATSGQVMVTTVTGLASGATYYFAIKTEDELGNLSSVSSVSPFALTNASPTVTLDFQGVGQALTGSRVISWSASDPNAGDSWTTSLWLSVDGGVSFTRLIVETLSRYTTYYWWDTRSVPNGAYWLKVLVSDQRGLTAFDQTYQSFKIDNVNEPPQVFFSSAPSSGQKVVGQLNLAWGYFDPNSFQTVHFDFFLSSNSGNSYFVITEGLARTTFTLDTFAFETWWGLKSLSTYRIKIIARDSGSPSLTGEAVSEIFEAVTGPPRLIELLKPLDGDFPTIFDLSFSWNIPSGLGGSVVYTLQYTTEVFMTGGVVQSGLTATNFTPSVGSLVMDSTYYWQVSALDSLERKATSLAQKFTFFRHKAKSVNGAVHVELLSGMPGNGFLNIQEAAASYGNLLAQAQQDALGDRLIQILPEPAWQIDLRDISGNKLSVSSISAQITFFYPDSNSDGYLDATLIDANFLKVARLNENRPRWEVIQAPQALHRDSKSIGATVETFSVFSLVAWATPMQRLSGVTNFPNPFKAGKELTHIRYVLTENANVTIRIYTLLGDLVRVLEFGSGSLGGVGVSGGFTNEVLWDGKNGGGALVANGMYVAHIMAQYPSSSETQVRRIGVVK